MKNEKVSVNILNYNGKRFIKECIDGLLKQNYTPFEIVFIDNASQDGSVQFVKENYNKELKKNKIKILSFLENKGFAQGYNEAYRKANCDFFLLINNDVKVTDKSLIKKLINKFSSSDKIGSVGCVDLPFGQGKKDIKNSLVGGLSVIQTNVFDMEKRKELLYSGGVCCLIRKNKNEDIFEEDYFAYAEDVYLGLKLRMNRLRNVYVYDTFINHHGAGTSGRGSPLVRFHSEKNRIKNILYFYELKTLIKIIPLFLVYQLIAGCTYLLKPRLFLATLKAHLNVVLNFRKILKKRKEIQKERKIGDSDLIKLMSYKLFSEDLGETSYCALNSQRGRVIYQNLVKAINTCSRMYCRLVGLKTRELN